MNFGWCSRLLRGAALANKEGTIIIRDETEFHELNLADDLEAMENHYHRVMWLFLIV
jgi:hypothetical protein